MEDTENPKQPSPELEAAMNQFIEAVRDQVNIPSNEILERATPRWEYRKCRKWDKRRGWSYCEKCFFVGRHYCQGPYLYLYWKEKGKLRKKYVGKDPENMNKKIKKVIDGFIDDYKSDLEGAGIDFNAKITPEEFEEKTRGLF